MASSDGTKVLRLDLCDSAKETCDASPFTPNASAPTGMFWSNATGKIYSYLSGYVIVVEVDPVSFTITRTVDIAPPGTPVLIAPGSIALMFFFNSSS